AHLLRVGRERERVGEIGLVVLLRLRLVSQARVRVADPDQVFGVGLRGVRGLPLLQRLAPVALLLPFLRRRHVLGRVIERGRSKAPRHRDGNGGKRAHWLPPSPPTQYRRRTSPRNPPPWGVVSSRTPFPLEADGPLRAGQFGS